MISTTLGHGVDLSITKKTVLVIDDDSFERSVLTSFLKDYFVVLEADSGQEGLDLLKKKHRDISIVLLDLVMPEMDGFSVLEAIRKDMDLRGIPVLIVSSTMDFKDENRCLKLGAVDFISKPYNPELTLVRIKNAIRLKESTETLSAVEIDELTGVLARQFFLHHAENIRKISYDTSYTLLAIDIDNFKMANEQYGEDKCNEFLGYIGHFIKERLTGGLAGRYGGDQFILLLEDNERISEENIKKYTDEVIKNAPIPHQTIKVGIYKSIDMEQPMTQCCDRAFMAIRGIKGVYQKDVSYYTGEMHAKMMEEQRILDSMESSLQNNDFKVYYQPKHDSGSGKIIGAEALVRWVHPEFGFMNPGQFIPLFERNGFISKLDEYVYRKVCKDMRNWKEKGLPRFPVSVNVSRKDYLENGFIDNQIAYAKDMGIDPSLIHVEVTETLYQDSTEIIVDQVRKLQKEGHLIEMDDFGTGYSSLSMLTQFPLDVIKLDISFVRNLAQNQVVVDAIINLAHKMGMKLVAEGVETEEQYETLKEMGCDFIQGYYFSKPLPLENFEEYLSASPA